MTNQALPPNSRRALEEHLDDCQNLGLIVDKFAPWGQTRQQGWDLVVYKRRKARDEQPAEMKSGEAKGVWLSTPRRRAARKGDETPPLFEVPRTNMPLLEAQQQRWYAMVEGRGGIFFAMQTVSRLVVGLGAAHVLETALTLDRSSGAPVIPGSTIKGLTRTSALFELAHLMGIHTTPTEKMLALRADNKLSLLEKLDAALAAHKEKDADDRKQFTELLNGKPVTDALWQQISLFRAVFGTTAEAGSISFVEAIYAGRDEPRYRADVMTPHFKDYYTAAQPKPPADNQEPNPISFLTVDEGSVFVFGLLPRTREPQPPDSLLINSARTWLRQALTKLGAGGKTASGYGFFAALD